MTRLYSYTVRVDDGAAPNPFRGMCSLAICKPGIRRTAKIGDWVAGLGPKNAQSGDLSGRLVYAMKVERVLSLQDYDELAQSNWPHRIPKIDSSDLSERLGDCIYQYSKGSVEQRPSVHDEGNIATDLGGKRVLISSHFYYFGGRALQLPKCLLAICHQTQGHKSFSNDPYVDTFVNWIAGLKLTPGQMYGWPDYIIDWKAVSSCGCSIRKDDDKNDPPC